MRLKTDQAQGALIMVMAMTIILISLGAVLMQTTLSTDTLVQGNMVQRYSYRALEAGENTYVNVINTNPNAVNCSSASVSGDPTCLGVTYDTWIPVPNITTGNGASPEAYLFGNPQPVVTAGTGVVTSVQVRVIGVAGSPGHYVYTSSTANLLPVNGFLNHIWWTTFQSFDGQVNVGTGNYTPCSYYWQRPNPYNTTGKCTVEPFTGATKINGPVFSNDSIFVDNPGGGKVIFGNKNAVVTADPNCQFVSLSKGESGNDDSSPPACNNAASDYVSSYDAAHSSIGHPILTLPLNNQPLATQAAASGCLYSGPTTVTLTGTTMTVLSKDTPGYPAHSTASGSGKPNTNVCQTNGLTAMAIPSNGVIFVQTATAGQTVSGANPFDGQAGTDPQTVVNGCPGCYYGQSNTPDAEADAFVSGHLSGRVSIATQNDIVIDGNITYDDCTWAGPASQSLCLDNPITKTSTVTTNDSLGLIADNYVEVDHPVYKQGGLLPLPLCGLVNALPPPLCDPSGSSTGSGSITIDASIVALTQSFVVNNYATGSPEGTLYVYGSIAQNGAGPIAAYNKDGSVNSGYLGDYTWDPRLALFFPPGDLQPVTTAFNLGPSSTAIFVTLPSCLAPWPNLTSTPPVTCGYHP